MDKLDRFALLLVNVSMSPKKKYSDELKEEDFLINYWSR